MKYWYGFCNNLTGVTMEVATYKGMYAAKMYSPAEDSPPTVLRACLPGQGAQRLRVANTFPCGKQFVYTSGLFSSAAMRLMSEAPVLSALSEAVQPRIGLIVTNWEYGHPGEMKKTTNYTYPIVSEREKAQVFDRPSKTGRDTLILPDGLDKYELRLR